MSRYVERAENLARLVDVRLHDLLETGEAEHGTDQSPWKPLLHAASLEQAYLEISGGDSRNRDVSWFITFSQDHPHSILQCIAQARENARMVRDQISEDMWLELNSFHLFVRSEEAQQVWRDQPADFYRRTIRFCMLFDGLIDSTILRDEGWQFIRAGKFLERADKTTRVMDMIAYQGDPGRARLASALRSCSGFSAFREEYRGEITLTNVVDFLLFSQSFPRSVRFCLRQLDDQLHTISGEPSGTFSNEAERLSGSLVAKLNFSSSASIWDEGLHSFIDGLQVQFNEIGQQIFETYVLLPLEIRSAALRDNWQWQQHQQQQ